jgi:hypothetical protein
MIIFLPQMSHDDVAAIQMSADVLLFLGFKSGDNQGQVSIKLFEYFRRQKPILPTAIKAGSDVDELLQLYCGKTLRLNNSKDLAQILINASAGDMAALPTAQSLHADEILMSSYHNTVLNIITKQKNELSI